MQNKIYSIFLLLLGIILTSSSSISQSNPEVHEIVSKNIQAAGGERKLSQIQNYAFKAGPRIYYMSSQGIMKITSGNAPVISEIILTSENEVKRNCYNNMRSFKPLIAATYQALAKLRSGFFTLKNYADQLEFIGKKRFGPKTHYHLASKSGMLDIDLFIDSDDFLLRRIVLKGFGPAEGKYEINQDFSSYQEISGIKLPESWFSSQVGSRGVLHEISEVQIDLKLDDNFFYSTELNAGEVSIAPGNLKGNIVDFSMIQESRLTIATNWTRECIEKAGFQNGDKLLLLIGDEKIDIQFFNATPPRSELKAGAKFIVPNRRDENFVIYILSPEYKHLGEFLSPLLPIQVTKSEK